jgi:hypothetical protein
MTKSRVQENNKLPLGDGPRKMARLSTLQVMRAVAVNLVILYHLTQFETVYAGKSILPAFCVYGMSGVDIFFVLSGFIMVAVAGKDIGAIQFLWRRAIRIYPPYWLVTLIILEFSRVGAAAATDTISLWRSFLLVPDSGLPLLTVGWTLVHEVYFYLVPCICCSVGTADSDFHRASRLGPGCAHRGNRRRRLRDKFSDWACLDPPTHGGIYNGGCNRGSV